MQTVGVEVNFKSRGPRGRRRSATVGRSRAQRVRAERAALLRARGPHRRRRARGGQRRYERSVLRRLAFIRAARNVGLGLEEVARALSALPDSRTPTKADWTRLSRTGGPARRADRRPRRRCATGSTRASAAAACRCGGARCGRGTCQDHDGAAQPARGTDHPFAPRASTPTGSPRRWRSSRGRRPPGRPPRRGRTSARDPGGLQAE